MLNSKDNWDLGIRTDDTERETYRGVLGLEGEFSDNVSFEMSYTYGETDVEYRTLNQRYNDRYAAAVDVVTDPVSGQPVCRFKASPRR